MFRQNKGALSLKTTPMLDVAATPAPRFAHPQVMLLDVEPAAATFLQEAGFNVSTGSFGTTYGVRAEDGIQQVIMNGNLPSNYTEQEVVIVNLAALSPIDGGQGKTPASIRQNAWWARTDTGLIDPRPGFMVNFQRDFDRILGHGGVFIIFADAREEQGLIFGHVGRDVINHDQFIREDVYCDNWSLLSLFAPYGMAVPFTTGRDIRPLKKADIRFLDALSRIIEDHGSEASFSCTLQPTITKLKERRITLATNRFDAAVAALISPSQEGEGWVIILPNLNDCPRLLKRLLTDVLPEMAPQLFPHAEGARWVEHPEYELPGVLALREHIRQAEEDARARVVELEERIVATRHELGYLHALLTEQGRPLVEAVKRTLETLGFQNVIDVDAEMDAAGKRDKDEDLRIEDGSPFVLVEVKGVHGTSTDDDALQVLKHIRPRMKQMERFDINGLSVINHQCHLPALQREPNPFNPPVLATAREQDVGLLTTWDLYRLTRGFLKNGWKHEHIRDLFSRGGRVLPTPIHYMAIGTVEKFWERVGVASIRLTEGGLALGDHIAFDLPVEFEEQTANSLQIERNPVDCAPIGELVGVKVELSKDDVRVGTQVYKVLESVPGWIADNTHPKTEEA